MGKVRVLTFDSKYGLENFLNTIDLDSAYMVTHAQTRGEFGAVYDCYTLIFETRY